MNSVLIVEDDKAVRNNTEIFLKAEGFNVFTASNGLEALKITKNFVPDVIIADIIMPYVDGIELYKKIQHQHLNNFISFIFLTAKCDLPSIREGLNTGADDYITKPFEFKDLLISIQKCLAKKQRYNTIINDLKNTITMNIPHELRTPLSTIIGYTGYLENSLPGLTYEEIAAGIGAIGKAGRRLQSRIEKFLFFASVENDIHSKLFLNNYISSPFNISETFLHNLLDSLTVHYERPGDLSLDIDDACLQINKEHLSFIVKELADNAFKFSSRNSLVCVKGKTAESAYIITVQDSGRGMNRDEISLISSYKQFQRDYYQQTGLGLGLYLVKRIIELHEGKIKFASIPGKSTRIDITLKTKKQKRSKLCSGSTI